MKKYRRMYYKLVILGNLITVILLFILVGWALAKEEKFPTRPINIIVPWAPGSGATIIVQALKPYIERATEVGVVIVNKPGAGSTIGLNYVANSPPDGYTVVLIGTSTITSQYVLRSGVSIERFTPFINAIKVPLGVVVRADSPWRTFKEFVDYAKANPGKVQMGNAGYGASFHIATLGLEMVTGVKFTHVPFKGSGPNTTALLGGHVDGTVEAFNTMFSYVEAKKLRMLAVVSSNRLSVVPDVPTLKECGYDLEVSNWYGYAVPKGTPQDRIKILHDAFKVGVDSEEFKAFYEKQGSTVAYIGLEGMEAFIKKQDKIWKSIIEFGGFKPMD